MVRVGVQDTQCLIHKHHPHFSLDLSASLRTHSASHVNDPSLCRSLISRSQDYVKDRAVSSTFEVPQKKQEKVNYHNLLSLAVNGNIQQIPPVTKIRLLWRQMRYSLARHKIIYVMKVFRKFLCSKPRKHLSFDNSANRANDFAAPDHQTNDSGNSSIFMLIKPKKLCIGSYFWHITDNSNEI